MLMTMRFPDYPNGRERDHKGRVRIMDGELLLADINDVYAEFFAELSTSGDANGFSGFTFSARELP